MNAAYRVPVEMPEFVEFDTMEVEQRIAVASRIGLRAADVAEMLQNWIRESSGDAMFAVASNELGDLFIGRGSPPPTFIPIDRHAWLMSPFDEVLRIVKKLRRTR